MYNSLNNQILLFIYVIDNSSKCLNKNYYLIKILKNLSGAAVHYRVFRLKTIDDVIIRT